MQFDEFDKKAKEAADHHHPAYDEQAWAKMEKLLHKHMPEEKDDKRRFIFFLLLFLGLGSAGVLIVKSLKGGKALAVIEKSVQQKQADAPLTTTKDSQKIQSDNNREENKDNEVATPTELINNNSGTNPSPAKQEATAYVSISNKKLRVNSTKLETIPGSKLKSNKQAIINSKLQQGDDIVILPETKITEPVVIKISEPVIDVPGIAKNTKEPTEATTTAVANADNPVPEKKSVLADIKKESQPVAKNNADKSKNKAKKRNLFFFTLSTGPDVSSVNKEKAGAMKLLAGAGLGYTFNSRFTIRTGFYAGRKVYTASPAAYHPPAIFYTYYPYLEKVDADCKVYEIPLSVNYNFGISAKQNWFGSAGVSSYLMKSETYNYFYKYSPTSPITTRERTITNQNNHFFSTLTLSGGYQRSINKSVSFMVEPYVKLPLSGVGYGKVKLNSGGVLFSFGIKPFGLKKAKSVTNQ